MFQGLPGATVFSVSSQFSSIAASSAEEGKMCHRPSCCSLNLPSSSAALIPREVRVSCKHTMAPDTYSVCVSRVKRMEVTLFVLPSDEPEFEMQNKTILLPVFSFQEVCILNPFRQSMPHPQTCLYEQSHTDTVRSLLTAISTPYIVAVKICFQPLMHSPHASHGAKM